MTPRAAHRALRNRVGTDITVYTIDGRSSTFQLRPRVHRSTITGLVFTEDGEHVITVACAHITMISLPHTTEVIED